MMEKKFNPNALTFKEGEEKVKKAKETLKEDFSNQAASNLVGGVFATSNASNDKRAKNLIHRFGSNNNNNRKGGRRRVSKKRPTRTVKRSHRK